MITIDREAKRLALILVGAAMALIIFCAGLQIGAVVSGRHAEAYRIESVENAVTRALETHTPLSCEDNKIIEAIKAMALNGGHVRHYDIFLELDNKPDKDGG